MYTLAGFLLDVGEARATVAVRDAALASVDDATICQKVLRAVRRGR